MSVYSMTGYAAVQSNPARNTPETDAGTDVSARLGVEIRSVNSRFLDLAFRLPDELRQVEPALRELLTGKLKRGKIEMRVSLESNSGSNLRAPAASTLQRLGSLEDTVKSWLPHAAALSVADVLRLAGGEDKTIHDYSDELLKLSKKALKDLLAAREREGARLAQMLLDRTAQLRALAASAVPMVPKLVEQQKIRFMERWQEAMALGGGSTLPEAAQDRALTEATSFAIRIDVAEEITRLSSHLDEIDRLLAAGGEVGKRLDFLIQELHREANTLGSKSGSLELTHVSVDMKVLIEQIREQVQNIE
ncbi:MAG: YicC family protein [Polaromonas sp.]|uniref:YicC/YloC family endoribonuclease n=1 Tax=Polaromonas sp. TaxID=1869339 RepID=UPI002488578A|nr:YicC/YloC family endoribonuclease [Polaromonas sp.]MDI1236959.1 YicC family protein [Polaromonas sp.]MDI1339513.1 YicC family protein [Polaromonas sp.]